MTKKQQLQQELFQLKAKAKELLDKDGVTAKELEEINNKINVVKSKIQTVETTEEEPIENSGKPIVVGSPKDKYETAFYNALSRKATIEEITLLQEARNSLGSASEQDGGYLIPVDQQTEINELKRAWTSLRDFVTVEPVLTLTGSRVLEKEAENTPFPVVGEGTAVSNTNSPQFETVTYSVKKYGGILPVPNELLADSKAKLRAYLNRWIAKKTVATENSLIIEGLKTFTKKDITGIDDIKDILGKELDPAIASASIVICNQDSFNYLDKLKDSQGNYILEKDPKNPTKKLLSGRQVVVLSNNILKTDMTKAPVIIGSLKEAIVLFDRQAISILATNIGGSAFTNDRTDIRALTRLDVQKFDKKAVIYGEVTISE